MPMTDLAPPVVFIDEDDYLRPDGSATPSAHRLYQPAYEYDWDAWTEVTWVLSVRDTAGSPSSWSLTPVLEYAVDSAKIAGPEFSQWRERRWFAADPAVDCAEGGFFPTITGAGTWKRTVRNFPRSMRVNLSSLAFVGGTDPRVRCTLIAYPKKG